MPETALNLKPRREDQTLQPWLCSHHLNLKGKIATEVAIVRELLKLPVLKSCCLAERQVDLVMKHECKLDELV